MKSISIVTPCRNAAPFLRETMESVLGQSAAASGRLELEYIVCDGASDDGTADLAGEVGGGRALVISEPDRSMYDALAKGLQRCRGEFVGYLNAGDFYHPRALDTLTDFVEQTGADWVCGYRIVHNQRGQAIRADLPFRYRPRLIRCGAYGTTLPFLQQESTFWSRKMQETVDLERLKSFSRAGDYFLWHSFSAREEPWIASALLGGHRIHAGQLSADRSRYLAEMRTITRRPRLSDRLLAGWDRFLWSLHPRGKKRFNRHRLFLYDDIQQRWY